MVGSKRARNLWITGMIVMALGGCMQAGATSGAAPAGGFDGPTFATDENGCRYEVILGERYPIVDERGRPQCSSL